MRYFPPHTRRKREPIDRIGQIIFIAATAVLVAQIAVPLLVRAW